MRKPIVLPFFNIYEEININGNIITLDVEGIDSLKRKINMSAMARYYTEVFQRSVSRRTLGRWVDINDSMSPSDKRMSDAFTALELRRLALENFKKEHEK